MLERLRHEIRIRRVKRHFRAFAVGPPRTGTTWLSRLFGGYRSKHEPGSREYLAAVIAHLEGATNEAELRRFALRFELEYALELHSACYLIHTLRSLVDAYPEARFIGTERDPVTWMESVVERSHQSRRDGAHGWIRYGRLRYPRSPDVDRAVDLGSRAHLERLARYYDWHVRRVREIVPEDRLLVVATEELSSSTAAIAAHVGVDESTLRTEEGRANRGTPRTDGVPGVDRADVERAVAQHCSHWLPPERHGRRP